MVESVAGFDHIVVDLSSDHAVVWCMLGAALKSDARVVVTIASQAATKLANVAMPVLSWDLAEITSEGGAAIFADGIAAVDLAGTVEGARVFISYSHLDQEHLARLLVHLRPIEREGRLDLWVDTRLRAGDEWEEEIRAAIARCTVAILLISADFLASEFIIMGELQPILREAQSRGVRVVSLILKPCRFSREPELQRFQAINAPSEPLISCTETRREELFDEVAKQIENLT